MICCGDDSCGVCKAPPSLCIPPTHSPTNPPTHPTLVPLLYVHIHLHITLHRPDGRTDSQDFYAVRSNTAQHSRTMVQMTAAEKVELITRGLQEVFRKNIIEDVIMRQNRPLKIYWGSVPPSLRSNTAKKTKKNKQLAN